MCMEINILVIAGAKVPGVTTRSEIELKVKVSQVAEKGKANAEVIALLAKHFETKTRNVHIISGHTSAKKRVRIDI